MAKSTWRRQKKGYSVIVHERETEAGIVYEGFLGHPDLGIRKVLTMHEKTVEMLGVKNGEDLVGLIIGEISIFIGFYKYPDDLLPMLTLYEELNGYSVEWPPKEQDLPYHQYYKNYLEER